MPITRAIAQLRTTDLDGSIRFYTDTLGFSLAFRHQDFYAGIRAGERDDDPIFHLKHVDARDPSIAPVQQDGHFHLYFESDDAVALADALQAKGVRLREALHDTAWATREFVIEDNQGHVLYFGQPLDT